MEPYRGTQLSTSTDSVQLRRYLKNHERIDTARLLTVASGVIALVGLGITMFVISLFAIFMVVVGLISAVIGIIALELALRAQVRWPCSNCGEKLDERMPWKCGSCERENWYRSLFGSCCHCETKVSAFRCPRCDSTVAIRDKGMPASLIADRTLVSDVVRRYWRTQLLRALVGLLPIVMILAVWSFGFASPSSTVWLLAALVACGGGLYWGFKVDHYANVVIRWDCKNPLCGKRLESNIAWVCVSCGRENEGSWPFLRGCKHCKASPNLIECYHCGVPQYFHAPSPGDELRPARKKGWKPPTTDPAKERAEDIAQRQHRKIQLELDIEIAKLQAKLASPSPKPLDPQTQFMERLKRQLDNAVLECKTIAQTIAMERDLLKEIRASVEMDPALSERVDRLVSMKFEAIRVQLGADIQI